MLEPTMLDAVQLRLHAQLLGYALRRNIRGSDQGNYLLAAKDIKGIVQASQGSFRGIAPTPKGPVDQVADFDLLRPLTFCVTKPTCPTGWPLAFSETSHRPWPCRA